MADSDAPKFGTNHHGQRILGYIAPTPQKTIKVPDSAAGVGGGGFTETPSLESYLQLTVQQMVAGELDENQVNTQDWTDAQAQQKLMDEAFDRSWPLYGIDPDTAPAATAMLVAKYVRIFRVAVTPIV